jgi:hypothetical protein
MMARWTQIINSLADRQRAARWCMNAPSGMRIEFKEVKRSLGQNDLLWARLTDVAAQVEWYGQKLSPDDWKDMFTASLRKARVSPGIDPGSFVVLGLHTSDLSKQEFSDLLELIAAFGAEHGVQFQDDREAAA